MTLNTLKKRAKIYTFRKRANIGNMNKALRFVHCQNTHTGYAKPQLVYVADEPYSYFPADEYTRGYAD